jgi:hypothetical protein
MAKFVLFRVVDQGLTARIWFADSAEVRELCQPTFELTRYPQLGDGPAPSDEHAVSIPGSGIVDLRSELLDTAMEQLPEQRKA